jgi:hypothetical protein
VSSRRKRREKRSPKSTRYYYAVAAAAFAVILVVGFVALTPRSGSQGSSALTSATISTGASSTSASTSAAQTSKLVILYINQGNGAVNQSNFGSLLSFSVSHGFNTLFFQVYREGTLLFSTGQLSTFVIQAHADGLKIFFCLYITDPAQQIPTSIYPIGEDGISLDMSSLTVSSQQALYAKIQSGYSGTKAVTTDDMTLPLTPDLLILETYGAQYQQFIHPGIVAGVEVVATSSKADYEQQFQFALNNSDGVMVFDYAGLVKSGY